MRSSVLAPLALAKLSFAYTVRYWDTDSSLLQQGSKLQAVGLRRRQRKDVRARLPKILDLADSLVVRVSLYLQCES